MDSSDWSVTFNNSHTAGVQVYLHYIVLSVMESTFPKPLVGFLTCASILTQRLLSIVWLLEDTLLLFTNYRHVQLFTQK